MLNRETGSDSSRLRRYHRMAWLAAACAVLLLSPLVGQIEPVWMVAALVLVVVLSGLPHGALDPLVAHAAGHWHNGKELTVHLLTYTGLAAMAVGIWLIWPVPALAAFLVLSAWHFSGDWPTLPHCRLPNAFERLSLGGMVVGAPALFHPQRVGEIFAVLTGRSPGDPLQSGLVEVLGWLTLALLPVAAIMMLRGLRHEVRVSLELISLPLLAWLLPPLLYFVIYFGLLHSPRHLIRLAEDPRIRVDRAFWQVLVAMTLLTVGLGVLAYALLDGSPDQRLIQIVFIGLAALTVPHMLLIERFNQAG